MSALEEWAESVYWPTIGTVVNVGPIDGLEKIVLSHRHDVEVLPISLESEDPESDIYSAVTRCRNPHLHPVIIASSAVTPERMADLSSAMDRGISVAMCYRETTRLNTMEWIISGLKKLEMMKRAKIGTCLHGSANGEHGIIVASGPSLIDSIPWLKKAQRTCVIAAVTGALPVLEEHGIVADLIVGVESKELCYGPKYQALKSLQNEDSIICFGPHSSELIAEGSSCRLALIPQIVGGFARVVAGVVGYEGYDCGGSVTTVACEILRHMGCTTITACGLDLGYPNGQNHANGAIFGGVNTENQEVPSNDGGAVKTAGVLTTYRWWFEQFAMRNPKLHLWNTSEHGAKIEGWVLNTDPFHDDFFDRSILPSESILRAFDSAPVLPVAQIVKELRRQRASIDLVYERTIASFNALKAMHSSLLNLKESKEGIHSVIASSAYYPTVDVHRGMILQDQFENAARGLIGQLEALDFLRNAFDSARI